MADCSQEYWYMWKANKPVQETILNKHQIMECGRWLQRQTEKQARLQLAQIEQMTKLIERQSRKIHEQEKRMEELEETIKNMLTFGDCTNVFDAKFSPIYLKSDDYDESYSVVSQRTNEADIDIQEYSDEDSREERMKISAELCGNN
jgi:septation ring formation regulator EzrA